MFAWNNNRPTSPSDIMYHGTSRGSLGVDFFEDSSANDDLASAKSVNFTVDGVCTITIICTHMCTHTL